MKPMRILLATPPMTQLNTPYPATAYLTGFLRLHADALALDVRQADPALTLFLRLYSRAGLTDVAAQLASPAAASRRDASPSVQFFHEAAVSYIDTVDAVIRFLQGRDPGLALRIVTREFLPEGPRFLTIGGDDAEGSGGHGADDTLPWAFGALGLQDKAKYLASLYVDDLADVLRDGIDARFALSRYGERLAASAPSFQPIADALIAAPTLVDAYLDDITRKLLAEHRPDILGLTAPFPGNVYGAFRMARVCKEVSPHTTVVLGGGYVNTELRELAEPRVFDTVDFIAFDDGERPLLALIDHLRDQTKPLLRTMVRRDNRVVMLTDPSLHDIPHRDVGTPTYDGLPLVSYVSLFEMLNPMHRLWSDGRWNKLTVAHGCYWKKCTFCDITLDYIGRYDQASADVLVDRIEAMMAETGQSGFHLVDEAAPPAALKALAERLIARKVVITWWGNVRFEKTFTPALAQLLAESGCVAISGGLEAASDRLLTLMKKGVTVEQVARVTRAFTDAGIMVHAYLMYGFPSQTMQETIDALERVRQLFDAGCLQSAFWHRFAATTHSPIGKAPELFGITVRKSPAEQAAARAKAPPFARNDLDFADAVACDHDALGIGLKRALYNYMQGTGFDVDLRTWFDIAVPAPQVPRRLIADALR
ncbi:MAG: radical SAM protein [Myxococcales bacterium]|nr:radical SAM protein [Myxococcales bacterium]